MFSKTGVFTAFVLATATTLQAVMAIDNNDATITTNHTSISTAEEMVLSIDIGDKNKMESIPTASNGDSSSTFAESLLYDEPAPPKKGKKGKQGKKSLRGGNEVIMEDPKGSIDYENDPGSSMILLESLESEINNSEELSSNDEVVFQLQEVNDSMQRMLNLVNGERRRRGISELCFNAKLNSAALSHSRDMASNVYFSHTGSDGSRASARITRAGYSWRAYGENIASYGSVDSAHNGLMNSPGHRQNILNSGFRHIGIGIARYNAGRFRGNLVITQVFGNSNSEGCSGGRPCSDNPSNWYDSDGSFYNCGWYARGNNCQTYGDGYRNFGKTANEACCACGGGNK